MIVCSLAFMAVANLAINCVRAVAANGQLLSTRALIFLALAVVLCCWAQLRLRKQRQLEPARQSTVPDSAPSPELSSFSFGRSELPRTRAARPRWIRRAITVAMLAIAVVTVVSQWGTFESGLDRLGTLRWHNLHWAVYAEVLALVAFAQLTRLLLQTGGVRVRLGRILGLTLASNAIALTLPGGPAWSTVFSFGQLRQQGVRAGLSAYALAVTWTLSAIALVVIALVGIDLAGSTGPAAPFQLAATVATVLLGLLAVGSLVALRLPRCRAALESRLKRLANHPRCRPVVKRLEPWLGELGSVRVSNLMLARCFAAAVFNWIFDCGCLVFSILAVGGHVPWQGVLAAYAVAQLAAALPITPGGIGVIEGTLSVLLIAYHMPAATAVAAVLLYRILSFWILVPVGWATAGALVGVRRRGWPRPRHRALADVYATEA